MRSSLAAAAAAAAAAALGVARAQDAAHWTRLDALLPPDILHLLPTLLHIIGDLCELPIALNGPMTATEEFNVIEHNKHGQKRYAVSFAATRLAEVQPRRVALYAGGWGNTVGDIAAQALVPALLTDHQLVLELDVGAALGGEYAAAASRVGSVARAVTALVLAAERAGVPAARLHAVGFSLGAHAVGAGARTARSAGAGLLGRITALDPARPCFARGTRARNWRVSRADASFVQVVHSSGGSLGLSRPLGHVDVYGKKAQRVASGAAALVRAHNAAWREWARSSGGAAPLLARRCRNSSELRAARCAGDVASVGYSCTSNTRGIYLMDTNI